MNTRKMIADVKMNRDGVWIRRNEEFETSEEDAADLIAIGMAHPSPTAVEAIVEAVAQQVKRTYRRRDMTAQ